MKKTVLILSILLTVIALKAQTDIIYLAKDTVSIRECVITEVKNGNMVYYTKDSIHNAIEAVGIYRNGNYTTLTSDLVAANHLHTPQEQSYMYNGYDYDHYQKVYEKAHYRRLGGLYMIAIGLGAVGTSYIMRNNNSYAFTNLFFFGGLVFFEIGMPIWIANEIVASNNKKAMEKAKNNVHLSFGSSNNGVGLFLNFN